jgi:hypothetical protein
MIDVQEENKRPAESRRKRDRTGRKTRKESSDNAEIVDQ